MNFSFRKFRDCVILLVVNSLGEEIMNLKFVLNDYVLIWNLLFQASISEEVQAFKQKLWKNYRHRYNNLAREELSILKDPKNYIPNDDAIFDMVRSSEMYGAVREETELYRLELLRCWDSHKKEIIHQLEDILRFDVKPYTVLVVDPRLDIIEMKVVKGRKINTVTWGRRRDSRDYLQALVTMISHVLTKELQDYQCDYKEIVQAVIELAIDNELLTRLNQKSVYLQGDPALKYLKRQIYPYWLMYLGATKEELVHYMMRDQLAFDLDKYTYEKQLSGLDLYAFIDFCVTHQRHIVKIEELEII